MVVARAGRVIAAVRENAGLPRWEPYSLARRQTMLFDTDSRLAHDPRGGERRLYQQVPFVQRGTL